MIRSSAFFQSMIIGLAVTAGLLFGIGQAQALGVNATCTGDNQCSAGLFCSYPSSTAPAGSPRTCQPQSGYNQYCFYGAQCLSGYCLTAKCDWSSTGEYCSSASDCSTGLVCNKITMYGPLNLGTCQPNIPATAPAGTTTTTPPTTASLGGYEDACEDTSQCGQGLFCSQITNKCKFQVDATESCSKNSEACPAGNYCDPTKNVCTAYVKTNSDKCTKSYQCMSGSCKSGKCTTSGIGKACVAPTDCSDPKTMFCATDATRPYCAMKKPAGEACTLKEGCLSGTCIGNECTEPTPDQLSQKGAKCTEDSSCGAGLYCEKKTFKCAPLLANGKDCISGSQCASFYCPAVDGKSDKCADKPCGPADTNGDSTCQELSDTLYCSNGKCTKRLAGGATCNYSRASFVKTVEHVECLSGVCGADNKCGATAAEKAAPGATTKPGSSRPKLTSGIADVDKKLALVDGIGLVGTSAQAVIGTMIKTLLGLIGSITLAIFIYGGIMWMTAGGKADKIKQAEATFVWAALGLVVIFASYAIVSYIISIL